MKKNKLSFNNILWRYRKYWNKLQRFRISGRNKHRQHVLEKHIERLYKKLESICVNIKRATALAGVSLCMIAAPRIASAQLNFASGVDFLPLTIDAVSNGHWDHNTKIFDIDGDGDKDAFFMGDQQAAKIYKNNGSGTLTLHQTVSILNNRFFSSYVHNLDGDSDQDIVIRLANNKIQVMTNDGSGTFSVKQQIGSATSWENSNVATGDIDGDSDIDIVSVEYYGTRFYKNDGSANFTLSSSILSPGGMMDGKLIDLDRDGDLDFLLLDEDGGKYYSNNGSGTFTLGSTFGNNFVITPMVEGDFNNDGYKDCYVPNLISNGVHGILYNNGTMTPAATTIALSYPRIVANIDSDSDVDLGIGPRFYLNNGSGTFTMDAEDFTVPLTGATSSSPYVMAAGDMDGDGDLDVFAGANGSDASYNYYQRVQYFKNDAPVTAPEINVQGNSTSIADGDATPSSTDHTDFGSQSVCSGTIVRTFTIQNTGTSNLTISSVNISGTNAADFSVTTSPSSPVAASGSTTFQVTFNPSATGTRSATITISNNDANEGSYDFAIQGTGTDPEINLQGNSTSIADGDATPSTTDHTDFGSQSVCSGTIVRTFTIQNSGTSNLAISSVNISGTNAADFSVTTSPSSPVAASGSTTFQVTFNPSATGTRSATITVNTDDCDEAAYDFAVQGTGTDPEINVQGNSTSIADGDATPSSTDHTDFGSQSVCSGTIIRTFTIQNSGTSNLVISSVNISGTNAADFSVTTSPSSPVAASGSTTFQVTFNPSATGTRSATITVNTDDCDEAAYDFAVQGTGTDPEINVQGNSTSIADGDATPSTTDHTDFVSQSVCSGTIIRTFTIQNTGTSNLVISSVNISGTHAADYSITSAASSPVAASGSTTFQVTFNPSATGTRSATITVNTDDCDEAAYDFAVQGTGTDPEINLQGNSTSIADGDATPSTTDHTDFGSQSVCSGTIVRTFTIQNSGTSNLAISSVNISGTNAADFSVTSAASSPVAASGSTTFQVTFNPSATGTRSATITVNTDDCDEAAYDFAVQGTGTDPEINLQGNSTSIADGDATPSSTDHTDFGSQSVCSGTIIRTFTIQNSGTSNLVISSVNISGTNAADFSVTTSPSSPVAASGSTTFQVTFNPSATGTRSATITVNTDDCDEAAYDFAVQGTGTDPEINLQGNSTSIADGDATPSSTDHTDFGSQSVCSGTIIRTFTIQNSGTSNLVISSVNISGTNAADFSVTTSPSSPVAASGSTTFQVTFNPSATGTRSATITVNTDDCDEAAYDFAVQGTGTDPEINLQGNSTSIADGDATPSSTDHTDFGSQSVCSGTIIRTFTIQNSGTSNLVISSVNISGTNAADFSVTTSPSSPVAASGSTTFQVTFNPSATGTRSATITVNTDDCDEAAYDFAVQGTGTDPEINVQGNSTSIADGDATPSSTDHTDFGSQSVCSGTIIRTFTIQNTGTSNLAISSVNISGTNAADFSVTSAASSPVAASGSTTFQVTFNPSATGTRSATITVNTDDCDEAAYDFAVQGTGTDPEINLQGNSTSIADGDATPSSTDHTDFGSQSVCSGTIIRTFTIQNSGTSNLVISSVNISGTNAADFSVTTSPSSPVAASGSTTFQVTFNPSATGTRSATITVNTDDCDEAAYDFAVQGTGTDPEINVQGNSTSIADGDATPSSTDHTDFGSQSVCSGTIIRTFTIQNSGTSNLVISSVNISGTNVADFSVTTSPSSPVAASGSTTFQVTFNPSATGTRSATITVNTDDCDEAAYDFAVQGTGNNPIAAPSAPGSITGNTSVCSGSTQTYSISPVTDATTYTWTVPSDAIINTGQGTTFVSVTFGSISDNVSVTASNLCGTSTASSSSVTVNHPVAGTDVQTACSSFTWIDGNTYSSNNNTATHTISSGAANGCDSVVTLNLTIKQPVAGTDVQTACSSFTWIDGNTYTSDNNTATHTISGGAANGCDSIVTLNLTVNQPATGTDFQTACSSFTWIDGNTYTSDNNTATHTISGGAVNGCDSVITLNLTVNQLAASTDVQTACGSFTWIDGNTYTSDNNTATHTISGGAANGCDSVVTLNLIINTVDVATSTNGLTITANAGGATYQWIDCNNGNAHISGETTQSFTATATGNYAVIVTQNGCTDSSACVNIIVTGLGNYKAEVFAVYPNPANNQIILQVDAKMFGTGYKLFDNLGKIILSGIIVNDKTVVDITEQPVGIYFIQLNNGIKPVKVIKQ